MSSQNLNYSDPGFTSDVKYRPRSLVFPSDHISRQGKENRQSLGSTSLLLHLPLTSRSSWPSVERETNSTLSRAAIIYCPPKQKVNRGGTEILCVKIPYQSCFRAEHYRPSFLLKLKTLAEESNVSKSIIIRQ